ncbi:MAG: TolC family protein [Bacteroidales bacterium]|jgi:outer membrane protein TolC|nr:TolC family protein [Bacteroidales bacterium]
MNNQKKNLFILLFTLLFAISYAQEARQISLQECMDQAVMHNPQYGQHQLQSALLDLKLDNLRSDLLPKISLNGKASWQNEVVSFPIEIPGISIPTVSKDQYRLSLDVNQPIYRGGLIKRQNELEQNVVGISNMLIDKELYELKSQTKNLFFQIILVDKQKQIVQSYREILEQKYNEAQVLVDEGVALASILDVLKLELLNTQQELFNIEAIRKSFILNLNELTQMDLDETILFSLPMINDLPMAKQDRFEYHLLSLQQQQLESSKGLLDVKTKPMLFAFATAGVGRPSFNMLSNDFDDFYMIGLNLKWDLWDWNKNKNEKKMVDINKELIETQKQTFELNIQLALDQLQSEIEKQKALVDTDPEIIALRENVVKTAEAQFKNGTITSTDYVVELQKLNQAKLNFELHQIGLINSQLAYIETLGKL